jgi:hypothetical protein
VRFAQHWGPPRDGAFDEWLTGGFEVDVML